MLKKCSTKCDCLVWNHLIMTFWKSRNVVLCFIIFYRRFLSNVLPNLYLYVLHYQQFDRSMGLWIINDFLKRLIMQFVSSMLKGRTKLVPLECLLLKTHWGSRRQKHPLPSKKFCPLPVSVINRGTKTNPPLSRGTCKIAISLYICLQLCLLSLPLCFEFLDNSKTQPDVVKSNGMKTAMVRAILKVNKICIGNSMTCSGIWQ